MANPKFTMLSDTSRYVTVPGWEARVQSRRGGGAFVQFEGDIRPRGFRNTVLSDEHDCVAVFSRSSTDRTLAQTFLKMLEDAYRATDARLLLEHGDVFATYIKVSTVVEIHEWQTEIRKPSGIIAVSFTAIEVV